jgi:hypothetical protein
VGYLPSAPKAYAWAINIAKLILPQSASKNASRGLLALRDGFVVLRCPAVTPQKIAYLILAHNVVEQLARLVVHLRPSAADIFIHVDRKVEISPFERTVGPGVHFIAKRVPVYWGDYSQVEAILQLLEAALAHPTQYDYLVLLSGTDYPLRSATEIEQFFNQKQGAEFINCVAMPSVTALKPLSRLTDYKGRPGLFGWATGKARRGLVKHGLASKRDYKLHLGSLAPFAGSTWWALTRDACVYIREFVMENPDVMKFYENTFNPDEMVFQTILANSRFRSRILHNVTFTDWTPGAPSPSSIGEKHISLFSANPVLRVEDVYGVGELLFCRKVLDLGVSDKLDAVLESRARA